MKRSHLSLVFVAAIVALSRLPFLQTDLGLDEDGWRVVLVGKRMVEGLPYAASRLPGYPVQEFAYFLVAALFRDWPTLAFNAATAVVSVVMAVEFGLLLRGLGARNCVPGALALAFVPAVFVNSANTMDYVWGLAFVIGAAAACTHGRSRLGGVLAGLAVGCRITTGVALVPLALLIPKGTERGRSVLRLWSVALVVAALCFSPVLAAHGLGFFTFYGETETTVIQPLYSRAWVRIWSELGLLLLASGTGLALFRLVRSRGSAGAATTPRSRGVLPACASALLLWSIAFLVFPGDPDYLLPTVPFVLLALTRLLPQGEFDVVALLLCSTSFLAVNDRGLTAGDAFRNREQRLVQSELMQRILSQADSLPDERVLVFVGPLSSKLTVLEELQQGPRADQDLVFGRQVKVDVAAKAARNGFSVFVLKLPESPSGEEGPADGSPLLVRLE